MSYRFRLATMLKLRDQTRDERRRDLAQAYEAERILRDRLADSRSEIVATQERTRQAASLVNIDVEALLNTRRYELLMKTQVSQIEGQIAQVLEEIERRRRALLEADREVKVLEKLRERQLEQHTETERKRENKQLDDAALRGFRRQEATP
jgi:flagellar FliJ protein